MCKYGLLYLVASAIAVLRVQLHFVDCFNKRKKKQNSNINLQNLVGIAAAVSKLFGLKMPIHVGVDPWVDRGKCPFYFLKWRGRPAFCPP